MLTHLKKLSSLYGISGNENIVREYILKEISGKCEYHIDNLGNIIAFVKGKNPSSKKLMIAAHMDEVGMIVTYINNDGTISFAPVGGINEDVIAGRQVYIYNRGISGVIGSKAVHNLSDDERKRSISISDLYIDIGASTRQEAQALVSPGDAVSFIEGFTKLGSGRVCSKALDDRAGCAIMLDLINDGVMYDTYFAFTVQEEVGLRGAKTAAYSIAPDFAIVLETTTASDISGVSGSRRVCELGEGPVVSYMDRSTVYDRELYSLAFEIAEQNNIPCQTKSMIAGGNDSGAIHLSRNGVRTLAVSVPCRYLHSPSCVAQYSDIEDCEKLVKLLIAEINKL